VGASFGRISEDHLVTVGWWWCHVVRCWLIGARWGSFGALFCARRRFCDGSLAAKEGKAEGSEEEPGEVPEPVRSAPHSH